MKKQKKRDSVQASLHKPSTSFSMAPEIRPSFIFLSVVISCLTFLVYLPGLGNGFLDWDDTQYIVQNTNIRSFRLGMFLWALFDYRSNLWHPLTWISHALDYAIWGLKPFGHHLTNNFLHAVNTAIVVWLVQLLIRIESFTRPKEAPFDTRFLLIASGTTALFFGLHPIHVESVAWVSERKDLLYSLFYMTSIIAYIHFVSSQKNNTPLEWYKHRLYWLTLTLFLLSLASKPMAVTLPAVLMILDWYPLRRISQTKPPLTLLYEKVPLFALSAAISIITIVAQKTAGGLKSLENATISIRTAVAFRSLAEYLWNLFLPIKLLPFYPYPKDAALVKPVYLASAVIVIAITVMVVLLAKKQKIWLVVWSCFVISVLPVLGFFQAGWQAKADRFVYLPSLCLFLSVGIGCASAWEGISNLKSHKQFFRTISAILICGVCLLMLLLTTRQISIWKSTTSLWDYNLKEITAIYPEAYYLRGGAFRDDKQYDKAIEDFTKAISLDPTYAMAYIERAGVYLEKREYGQAIEDARRGISLNPDFVEAHVTLGNVFFITGDSNSAIDEYNAAISRKPDFAPAYIARGFVSKSLGKSGKAIEDYSKALSINPKLADIYFARGEIYQEVGAKDLAAADYRNSCELGNKPACIKGQIPF